MNRSIAFALIFSLAGLRCTDKKDSSMEWDGALRDNSNFPYLKLDANIQRDTVIKEEKFHARFRIIDSREMPREWLVNISMPRSGRTANSDTLRFIQLPEQDIDGYYTSKIAMKYPGEYWFLAMAECCKGNLAQDMVYFTDTLTFVVLE